MRQSRTPKRARVRNRPDLSSWRLEDAGQSTELTAILDAGGNYVAQWVPKRHQPLLLAAPAMLSALQTLCGKYGPLDPVTLEFDPAFHWESLTDAYKAAWRQVRETMRLAAGKERFT